MVIVAASKKLRRLEVPGHYEVILYYCIDSMVKYSMNVSIFVSCISTQRCNDDRPL